MELTVILFLVFSIFEGAASWQFQKIQNLRQWEMSQFERSLRSGGRLGLYLTLVLFIARFGGTAFLFYFGYKTIWYYAIYLYLSSLAICLVATGTLRRFHIGISMATITGSLIIPITFVLMWTSLVNF